jgi:hypothetical protein
MSVKRKVTVPAGASGMPGYYSGLLPSSSMLKAEPRERRGRRRFTHSAELSERRGREDLLRERERERERKKKKKKKKGRVPRRPSSSKKGDGSAWASAQRRTFAVETFGYFGCSAVR